MARNVIVINVDFKETRVALIEDGVIAELQIERAAHRSTVGNIVLGKVTRVLPGMQAAFIDVGQERAAFLHVEDLIRPDDFDAYLARDPREGDEKPGTTGGTEGEGEEGDEPVLAALPAPRTNEARPAREAQAGGGNRKRGRHRGRPDRPEGHRETLDFPRRDQARKIEPRAALSLPSLAEGEPQHADELHQAEESSPDAELPDLEPQDVDLFDASEIEFEDDLDSAGSVAEPNSDLHATAALEESGVPSGERISDDEDEDDAESDIESDDDDDEDEDAESDEDEDDAESVAASDEDEDEDDDGPESDDDEDDAESDVESDDDDDDEEGPESDDDEDEDDVEPDDDIDARDDFDGSLPGYTTTPLTDDALSGTQGAGAAVGDPAAEGAVVSPRARVATRRRFRVDEDEAPEGAEASAEGAAELPADADGSGPSPRGRRRRRRGGRGAAPQTPAAARPGLAPRVAPDAEADADAGEDAAEGTDTSEGGKRRRRRGRRRRGPEAKPAAPVVAAKPAAAASSGSKLTKRTPARVSRSVPISEVVREGDRVVVQISKEPIGTKGARVTSHVSLPGRYVVYLPTVEHVGISKRIGNSRERSRLRQSIEALKPKTGGLIVRTVAEGLTKKQLKTDVGYLIKVWAEVAKRRETAKPADILYEELDLVLKAARDLFTDEVDHIVIDDREQHGRLCRFVEMFMPGRVKDIKLYTGEEPMFDAYGIEDEIKRALSRKVPLPSGGSLIVDQAEALTAIDVNTGRYVGKGSKDLEETALKTNLEAVDEIAYQLRFRNLGGLVILDLIDMERADNRERVWRTLEHKLAKDKAKTTINRISDLGLIEMTRKRTRESLGRIMHEPCFYCDGTGHIQSRETISYEILRQIRRDRLSLTGYSVRVHAHPAVIDFLKHDARDALQHAERLYLRRIELVPHPEYHIEQYDLQGR